MSGSGREDIPDVCEWSGGPLRCLGVVGRPCRMSGSDQVALLYVWQMSGGPPGCPRVVGRPSRMSGSPYRMSGSRSEAISDGRERSGDPP